MDKAVSASDHAPAAVDSPDPGYWRDEVLKQVCQGRMTRKNAEAIARKHGAPPLCRPTKQFTTFDATLQLWTPEMALSWIKCRNASAVHRHNPLSYRDTVVWEESQFVYSLSKQQSFLKFSTLPDKARPTQMGYRLASLKATAYPDAYTDFDGSTVQFPDLDDVLPHLLAHLRDGVISAVGSPSKTYSDELDIKRHHWLAGSFSICPHEGGVLVSKNERYTNIHFRAAGFQFAYPALGPVDFHADRFQLWRDPIPKMEPYKQLIVDCLQAVHKEGLPIIRPFGARDRHLKIILGEDKLARWYSDIGSDRERKHRADLAFRKAMNRILKDVLNPTAEENRPLP